MLKADYSHTRGDAFTVLGTFAGNRTGWTGKSQVRDKDTDELLSELSFTWADASTGKFIVQTLDTNNWPVGKDVVFDVQITSPTGVITSSKAVYFPIDRDVTKDG